MIIISRHAKKEMEKDNITLRDIENCLAHGELVKGRFVKGKMRYLKALPIHNEKIEKICVVYAYEKENIKVITCYPRKRKNLRNWQKREN